MHELLVVTLSACRFVLATIPPLLELGLVTRSECIWIGAVLGVASYLISRDSSATR